MNTLLNLERYKQRRVQVLQNQLTKLDSPKTKPINDPGPARQKLYMKQKSNDKGPRQLQESNKSQIPAQSSQESESETTRQAAGASPTSQQQRTGCTSGATGLFSYDEDSPTSSCCKCKPAQEPKNPLRHRHNPDDSPPSSAGSTPNSKEAYEGDCCRHGLWRGDFRPFYDCTPRCYCRRCQDYDLEQANYSADIVRLVGKEGLNKYILWLDDQINGHQPDLPDTRQDPDLKTPAPNRSCSDENLCIQRLLEDFQPIPERLEAGGTPTSANTPSRSPSQESTAASTISKKDFSEQAKAICKLNKAQEEEQREQ